MLVSIYRLQKGIFKCSSKSRVFWGPVKAMVVLIRQGLNFDVCGFLQPFASLLLFKEKAGRGERI
jgi:Ni/Fe-hydrogenase subunit HybB-like protein